MEANEETAFRFQQRAEEIRVIASSTKNAGARELLLQLASHYDDMVQILQRIARIERHVRNREIL